MSPSARRPRLSAAGALLAALTLLLTLPTAAHAARGDASGATTPPRGSAHMGMGVAAHDGQGGLPPGNRATQAEGVDVSSHQGSVSWPTLWSSGVQWAYVKASEGTYYTNPSYTQQYGGSFDVGMIRGAYHFATPDTTNGATQADYFVDHGGAWTRDGRTLPGALDIEWNPYGDMCFGLSTSAMVTWIRDFVTRYHDRSGAYPVIYTAASWWTECTGNSSAFGSTDPLWIAKYDTTPGTLPAGWSVHTMWQYTASAPTVGDRDRFNGDLNQIKKLATG